MIQTGRTIWENKTDGKLFIRLNKDCGLKKRDTIRLTQTKHGTAHFEKLKSRKIHSRVVITDDTAIVDRDIFAGAKEGLTIRMIENFGFTAGTALLVQEPDGSGVITQ